MWVPTVVFLESEICVSNRAKVHSIRQYKWKQNKSLYICYNFSGWDRIHVSARESIENKLYFYNYATSLLHSMQYIIKNYLKKQYNITKLLNEIQASKSVVKKFRWLPPTPSPLFRGKCTIFSFIQTKWKHALFYAKMNMK